MAIYDHEPYEDGSKYSKSSNFVIVEVLKKFTFDLLINQSTNQQYSLNLTYRIFWPICIPCLEYTANFTIPFANIFQSVLVTDAKGRIVGIKNMIKKAKNNLI